MIKPFDPDDERERGDCRLEEEVWGYAQSLIMRQLDRAREALRRAQDEIVAELYDMDR